MDVRQVLTLAGLTAAVVAILSAVWTFVLPGDLPDGAAGGGADGWRFVGSATVIAVVAVAVGEVLMLLEKWVGVHSC